LIDSNIINYSKLEPLNVPRETFPDLEEFRSLIIEKNKEINLIGNKTEDNSRERHIIDSAQIVDIIDENMNICTDIGSGSGLPGIVLAIIMKHKKSNMKFHLYEKSYHKSNFLRLASEKLKLNVKIFQKDIFNEKNLASDIIVARAFKPLPVILELIESNFKYFKEIILFLGKSGKELLEQALTKWEFDYKERNSLTSSDSIILKIENLKKKK
jgi:16S rRNA (guanine527-N7)-methyltransferase